MVSYYHQVFSLTLTHSLSHCLLSHSHSHRVVLPPSVLSHSLLSHTLSHPCHPCEHSHGVVLPPSLPTHCSERVSVPTHTPMVSYYHQVITHPHQSLCSHSHFHGVVLPPSHHSHPHQSLCSHSLHFTSFSLQMHHQCITNHLPHSPTHHASIASSSLPITYHYQPPPIASSHSIQHS